MLHTKTLYSYNDVMIQPAVLSEINSRSECNPFKEDGKLPIFTAPMSTVVNEKNFDIFEKNGINAILPRNIDEIIRYNYAIKGKWAAFSLNEFKKHFCDEYNKNETNVIWKVLIDVANGHMKQLYNAVDEAKAIHGKKIQIMIGNIANPATYFECYKHDVDFVRCSIGTGCCCITSTCVSVHYPISSLIDEIYKIKINIFRHNNYLNKTWEQMPQIIADGGVRGYGDIIKAITLGSDYVMVGSVFASLIESAGEIFYKTEDGSRYHFYMSKEDDDYEKILKMSKYPLFKEMFGMASRNAQILLNGKKTKTSEGNVKIIPITGTIPSWTENMIDYLRSAMSYCNIKDIKDFNPENVVVNVISNNAKESINK